MNKLERAHWSLLAALRHSATLSAAAEAVHITQAAASQRLREAERRLGISLVERQGKSLRLNAPGLRLAEAGERMEQQLRNAEADAVWLGQRNRPRWRLVQNYHDNPELLVLANRASSLPPLNRDMELVRCGQHSVLQLLNSGDGDCVLLPYAEAPHVPGIHSEKILTDTLVAVVPAGSKLAEKAQLCPDDFSHHTYFTYNLTPQSGWEYERFFKSSTRQPANLVKIESTQSILALVGQGLGLTILPRLSCLSAPLNQSISMVALDVETIRFDWYLQLAAARFTTEERLALLAGLGPMLKEHYQAGKSPPVPC